LNEFPRLTGTTGESGACRRGKSRFSPKKSLFFQSGAVLLPVVRGASVTAAFTSL